MHILLINQFFYPDSAATSQLLTDLARQFAEQGHKVTVVCGASGYAWASESAAPPVEILRTRPLGFGRSPLARVASYATFLLGATYKSFRCPAPDLIITLTTPPLLPLVGTFIKRIRGARHLIWEMDLYPEIAVDLGVFRQNGWVAKIVGALADYARRHAESMIALGDDMKARLIARGIDAAKIHVVHNWADGREIQPQPFAPSGLTVHYSGNFGLAHDSETIRNAIIALQSDSHLRFIFGGAGPQRKNLEAFCCAQRLRNVEFRPYCDRARLSNSLAEGHIGLITQNPRTVGSVVPSKIYGIMAAGRPILYIGSEHATPARIIERFRCGWFIPAGDFTALISLLRRLAADPPEIYERGRLAREAFLKHFDRPIALARITEILGLQAARPAQCSGPELLVTSTSL